MNIAIFGAGGTGGILAAYLAKAGNDVTLLARGKHLAAIQARGITLETPHLGVLTVPVRAVAAEDYTDTPDILFICVKYYALDDAIALVKRIASKDTLVVPILNVFGTGEVIQSALDPSGETLTVLDGCIYVVAHIKEPGVLTQEHKILRVIYGYRPEQPKRLEEKAKALEAILTQADIRTAYTDDIRAASLEKFSFVSPMGAAGLYYGAKAADFQTEGEKRETFKALVAEVQAIGEAMGLTFRHDLVESALLLIDKSNPATITSMQRDVEAGRISEFAGLVTRVCELGKKYGVPTPWYDKVQERAALLSTGR
ncbi:ketopantoate reductase family protein [Selenomonas sp. TAMA-11512]|uniref:ketopantoate reductase family protein n=1 Tax=Selenomonas sp. TAMA-11512 TaxID=3095337 RepID=UPI00308D472E|nr:ketopantoate reductase family protein [Selenomonas sp. TAMA-11512]